MLLDPELRSKIRYLTLHLQVWRVYTVTRIGSVTRVLMVQIISLEGALSDDILKIMLNWNGS